MEPVQVGLLEPFWGSGRGLAPKSVLENLGRLQGSFTPQHGPNLGPKMEPKSHKYRYKNQSKNWCILGLIFGRILVDLGRKNGAKLAPKTNPKTMLPLKPKSQLNVSGLVFGWLSWVEVGSPNQSKIDLKTISTWESILASIFGGFCQISGAKLGRKIHQASI